MNKICILITTFLRDELLYKSVQSILDNKLDNFEIIVIDQGYTTIEKRDWLQERNVYYYPVSFDSGLSFCRNFGVEKAKELNCDYILLGSDSFLFNESFKKINNIVEILEKTDYDLIGFELIPSVCGWEAKLNLIEEKCFELDFIDKKRIPDYVNLIFGIGIHDIDICRNIFIAKIDTLLKTKWDNNFKLGEHEDFFWRYKQNQYKCGWTNYIMFNKMTDRPDKYAKYRRENFNQGLAYLRKKWGLIGWVKYINLERAK